MDIAKQAEEKLREHLITIPKRRGQFEQSKLEKRLADLTAKAESEVMQFAALVGKEASTKEEAVCRFEEYVGKQYRRMLLDKGLESAAIVIEACSVLCRLRETAETSH